MAWHNPITDREPYTPFQSEMKENADQIASILQNSYHWTLPAICAFLGNTSAESYLNPGQYELGHGTPTNPYGYGYGVGLMQWTSPDGGRSYPNPWLYYCQKTGTAINDGIKQCEFANGADDPAYTTMDLSTSIWGWINSSLYPVHDTFDNFRSYTGDNLDDLTAMFFYCAEWHDPHEDGSLATRKANARFWWDYFGGHPIPPGPTPEKKKKMKLYFMLKKGRCRR